MQMGWIISIDPLFARTVIALQFQSVAAPSSLIIDSLAITPAKIGLCLGPGRRRRDMDRGQADPWPPVSSWWRRAPTSRWAVTGRVVSGVGGAVIHGPMTKMVIDWLAHHGTSAARAIFISSRPPGSAPSLPVLPMLAARGSA